jgi:aminoglycoside phosphotransferase (APT) family kinase protein
MPRDEFLDRYAKLAGFKVNQDKLHYYEVFNNFKLGIITMASNARVAYGRRTHLDTLMNLVSCHGYACFAELARLLAI